MGHRGEGEHFAADGFIDVSGEDVVVQLGGVDHQAVLDNDREIGDACERARRIGGDVGVIEASVEVVHANDCTGSAEGDGVGESGDLSMDDCTVSGNETRYDGGGIYNTGTMDLSRCLISR